jgi:hypothetical protein
MIDAQRNLRITACAAVAILGLLSLVPGEIRPATGVGGTIEHVVAYAGTTLLLILGYQNALTCFAVMLTYAACLEIAQLWIPGRHSGLAGYLASASGVALGSAIAWLASTTLTSVVTSRQGHLRRWLR